MLSYLFAALPGFTVGKTEAVSKIDRVLKQVVRVTGRTGVLYSLSSYTPGRKICAPFLPFVLQVADRVARRWGDDPAI